MPGRGEPSAVARLADLLGIVPDYFDQSGRRHATSADSRAALLDALGYPAADDAAARHVLEGIAERGRERVLTRVRVSCGPDDPEPAERLSLRLPALGGRAVEWELRVESESREAIVLHGAGVVAESGTLDVFLPGPPALGYHEVHAVVRAPGVELHGQQTLIVTPGRFPSAGELLRGQRVLGLTANLYTVRSDRNWGVGDFTDVTTLLELAADVGAAFVGLSPLHALRNVGGDVSPYSPISRLFRNALYLDVEAVPELRACEPARTLIAGADARESLRALRAGERVDYAGVMALKWPILEALHRQFRAAPDEDRAAAFRAWREREGEALERFARFAAIDERQRAEGSASWREWPAELQDAGSPAVESFAAAHAERVDLHAWIQFELDRQLAEAARRGRELGLPIGLYQDLAIGTSPTGSDVWADPELFIRGASVGAPPDPLGPEGQNWGLPPIHPHRLAASGYRYWAALVRGAMRHAGALRIDHVLGLFRQFWIPEGRSGRDGAYVRFPTEHLLGVLALEATRAGAIVVGEDLGTVPPEVPPTLARWGMLTSKVLYFERGDDGGFRSPCHYARNALATANTHDLAPLAGFWRGRDLELRREVGLLQDDDALRDAQEARVRDRAALLALLVSEGIVGPASAAAGPDGVSESDLRAAVHALLRRAPCWLVGVSLDDLVGEAEPVNVPGVGPDQFPSWTRRLAVQLERLRGDPATRRALGTERQWVP